MTERQKQEGYSLKIFYDSNLERRVCIVQNAIDGTFGFVEEKYCELENGYWLPTANGRGSRLKTSEDAIREAIGRVEWLGSVIGR